MIALSLFDGKSSAFTAMELAGIPITQFFSSEIDKHAIQVSNAIHPNQTRLGDITQWKTWGIDWHEIDIVFAGFPCQAWSMAGKQLGDKDERGMLFWTMLDVMKHVNGMRRIMGKPRAHFLIENVKMKKEFEEYITFHMNNAVGDVHKILINSALVSAQNRERYYWTMLDVTQPDDRGIVLADIIEPDDIKIMNGRDVKCGRIVGRKINPETGKRDDYNPELKAVQRFELRLDDKSGCLTTVQKDNQVVFLPESNYSERCKKQIIKNSKHPHQKAVAVCTNSNMTGSGVNVLTTDDLHYRKLTPRECFRLQTVPEHYIDKILSCGVSNTQLYKIAGNGWTDEVIAHILRYLPC